MTFHGCFGTAHSKWQCALASLNSWSVLFPQRRNTPSVTFLLWNHSPLRRWHSGVSGWRCSERGSLTFPSVQPSQPGINLGQILGGVMWMLLSLCIWDLKESWRFGGCKSFGIFEISSPFLCGCLTAGQLRQGHPSSAPSGLCLLHIGLNGKVSLGFSWAIWGSYWPQFSLV